MKDLPSHPGLEQEQVRTALLLAAGTGSRLAPLTDTTAKCLVPVNEISILERLVDALRLHNFERLVIVVGHKAGSIRKFLGSRAGGINITYITSPVYKTTNNIYSLWLARKEIDEPFLLIESDLVFDPEMLKDMLQPDRIAVSKLQPWMNGTTVTINRQHKIKAFQKDIQKPDDHHHYKTVNIYSLSSLTWQLVCKRLDHHISNNMVNGYYETIFADMATDGCLSCTPVFFDADRWYEIDTIADLHAAALVCSFYHPSEHISNLKVSNQTDLDFLQSSKILSDVARSKRGTRRYHDRKGPSSMQPASPLAPQSI